VASFRTGGLYGLSSPTAPRNGSPFSTNLASVIVILTARLMCGMIEVASLPVRTSAVPVA
jgi:hypothetical protein